MLFYAGCAFTKSYVGYVQQLLTHLEENISCPLGLANAILLAYGAEAGGPGGGIRYWMLQ